jgi:hypothetical protein
MSEQLRIVPLELREANAFVAEHHRHHKPVQGHRFSIGAVDAEGRLVGAATVGRPVARKTDAKVTVEVTRLVTDGTPNACSFLYSAAARVAKALGYRHIQTFILEEEPGTSLKATGWEFEQSSAGGQWKHPATCQCSQFCIEGKVRRTDQPLQPKQRWGKKLKRRARVIRCSR